MTGNELGTLVQREISLVRVYYSKTIVLALTNARIACLIPSGASQKHAAVVGKQFDGRRLRQVKKVARKLQHPLVDIHNVYYHSGSMSQKASGHARNAK
jgi:hypothetical protein